jgi:hypothetical protein
VDSSSTGFYAIPIDNGNPWSGQNGKYFSTGTSGSSITITFTAQQAALAFLWGSIDTYNNVVISFNNGTATYTGVEAAAAASTIANGYQGQGGSAWVAISPNTPGGEFNTVTFTSSQYSLEFAGVEASTEGFGVPDGGMTLMLLGSALVGLETLRRKFRV